MTAPQFRALPWHDQHMYAQMLREDIEEEMDQSGEGRPVRFDAAGDLNGSPFQVIQVPAPVES